jgi:hypothetical protein
MKLNIVSSIEEFFSTEVEKISKRHGLNLSAELITYLSNILVRFASTEELKLSHPVKEEKNNLTPTEFWIEVQQLPLHQQLNALKFLGDYSLFVTGFFSENVRGGLLDMDYFQALGGKAYYQAGKIREAIAAEKALNLFFSLAESFPHYSEIFSELYDQTLLHSNEGALKVFEKWQKTNSQSLSVLLMQEGFYTGSKAKAQ